MKASSAFTSRPGAALLNVNTITESRRESPALSYIRASELLEIGCATGALAACIAAAGREETGLDRPTTMIERAEIDHQ